VGLKSSLSANFFSIFCGKFSGLGLDHFCGSNDGYNQLIEKHTDNCDYKNIQKQNSE
jgi:hypothetical protein